MIAHCKLANLFILWVAAVLLGAVMMSCGPADESVQPEIGNLPPQPVPHAESPITGHPAPQPVAPAPVVTLVPSPVTVQAAPPPPAATDENPTQVPATATPLPLVAPSAPVSTVAAPPTVPVLQNQEEDTPTPTLLRNPRRHPQRRRNLHLPPYKPVALI